MAGIGPLSLAFSCVVVLTRVGCRRVTQRSLTSPRLFVTSHRPWQARDVLVSGCDVVALQWIVVCALQGGGGVGDMVHVSWLPRTGWLGLVGVPAESALLRVMVGGVSR